MSLVTPEFVKKLEIAAEAALGNQRGITAVERQDAEEVLLSFRRSNPSYQDCRVLLENTNQDTVQYQAASAFKDAVIREWSLTPENDRASLQDFILSFVMGHQEVSAFVCHILTQILAVMIKLTTVRDKNQKLRESVYSFLTNLIRSGNMKQQSIACSITSALVLEFSITTKSTDMGVNLEQHCQCKKAFENYDLKIIFSLVLDVLKHLAASRDLTSKEVVHLLTKFLTIAEQLLNWNFTTSAAYSRKALMVQADRDEVIFKPHKDWESVLLNTENIHLFFALNKKSQEIENLSQICVSCLSQLASLQGPVFEDNVEKQCFYLKHFVQEFLQIYGTGKFNDFEALGVANICKNLINSNKLEIWAKTPEMQEIFRLFIATLTELTCASMAGAAEEEQIDADDHLYMESFEVYLDTWTTIAESLPGSKEFIVPSAIKIFEHYVKCHILPPDGTRSLIHDEHDIDEIEEDDRDLFSGQLMSIACLARLSPQTSLLAISMLFEQRILAFRQNLRSMQNMSNVNESLMENLYEDIHWIILIAGHIIADEYEGETLLIPPEIVKFSFSQKSQVDQNLTLQVLGSPKTSLDALSTSSQSTDVTVRVVAVFFSLCDLIVEATKSNMVENLSPEVVQDLVWFLKTWTKPYLFFKEEYYDEISPVFCAVFGRDSEGARWCVDYVTKFACTILQHWASEPKVLEETSELLSVIVEDENRCAIVSLCEEFWKLGHYICAGNLAFRNHPAIIIQQIMSSIVTVGTSNMNLYREKYWEQTMNLVKKRYHATTQQIFGRSTHNAAVLNEILTVLDLCRGVAEAATAQNAVLVFNFLMDVLSDGGKILHSCHGNQGIVVCTLELFTMVAHGQICYLKETKCRQLYEWSLTLLQAFSSITKDFRSRDAEEESFQDLSYIIELLTHLLSRDFIDFSDPDLESQTGLTLEDSQNQVSVTDVILYGIGIILPHLNSELLAYPSLCCQYFKLVTFMCEVYPEKIESLPPDIFNGFMYSLQIGLSSYGIDNCKLCLEAVFGLTELVCDHPNTSGMLHAALLPFTKLVFDVILVHAGDMELMRTAGETFFSMFRLNCQRVLGLFATVIEAQRDPHNKQRLASEFSKLSPQANSELKFDRKDRSNFVKVLEDVIFNIRGILCVK